MLNKITIRVKTFHGIRKVYSLEVGITETIDSLKEKLIKADTAQEFAKYKQIRLVYTIVNLFFLTCRIGQTKRT